MNSRISRIVSAVSGMFLAMGVARPAEPVVASGEELEVIQAMAGIITKDAPLPYDFLYFESDFSAGQNIATSIANPDRTQFCGLTRPEAEALLNTLITVSSDPVAFDKSVAKAAGLGIGHKKLPRFRYLMLSRVVFAADKQRAFVAVDLNGESGAVIRLEKSEGQWNKTGRCGGWVKT